ncbi:MAG: CehA/McbA family metallohydrolase [Planctomycetaceae bacterium]
MKIRLCRNAICIVIAVLTSNVLHAQQLTEANFDRLVPSGKEVDAIYGDYAIGNKAARAIIAAPEATRNANMTVRDVGGCLLDLTAVEFESDQLSAFYPGRRKFPFSEATTEGSSVTVTSSGSDKRPKCVVTYQMNATQPSVEVTTVWTSTTAQDWTLTLEDDIRADGGKEDMVKSPNGTTDVFYVEDAYWQQAYAVIAPGYHIRCNGNSRESVLTYEPKDGNAVVLKPGKSFTLTRQVLVGKELPSVLANAEEMAQLPIEKSECEFTIMTGSGHPAAGARVELRHGDEYRGTFRPDQNGAAAVRLPVGTYTVNASLGGSSIFPKDGLTIDVRGAAQNAFELQSQTYRPGIVRATIMDDSGQLIPAKVQFNGNGDTPTPDWGPDTAEHFVRNVAYTSNGRFETSLQSGTYDVTVSRGPEYDAVFTKVIVDAEKTVDLKAVLKHSVQTSGWVSSDFHSHSSPSGDNTGSQKGRVLNLAAEQIEFAPCTEHNRVSTYDHHIAELGLKPFLATVSGMELTGQPLPLNHQNVFPMKYSPRTQDGGGPVTDTSPETQMERLALWDDRSEKLIQQNHPDIGWLFYDKNGDGKPDEGHSRSFPLMDVMEIHPIDRILNVSQFDVRGGKPFNNNRMLNWLQLLNRGFRIYGVVNTDAHYNFHGSGWLRNWIQSSTDDPAEIDFMDMVHASEQGRLIMSNGPFLEATLTSADDGRTVVSGQDLEARSGKVNVHVRVQCPNWFDVDTVFVMVNGRIAPNLHFTRTDHADRFTDDVVKFDQTLDVDLKQDSHIVVVTGHRTELLGDVMGPEGGAQHPAALTNPVFVDIDGDGFKPNQDTLDFPLPVKFSN